MELSFSAIAIEWRGPAPFVFVPVPPDESELIRESARELTYGWGAIPVSATIGATTFTTSLFPREGRYLLPLKVAVQRAEGVGLGDEVAVRMRLGGRVSRRG
ncbi:DUF1905 domain-containing protein [Agrococcus sp. HG114]|uniref:DUF1905 domain-containing protein n=1 Tax=Agrococcus sp. HG114 TaxID=2969757 RepID=UPI00215AD980|nr:DUF1905 domain-containing protein [Agrococcus sp. HG114]MCR8671961.1 DUF1905 domain-containing protein [Agrococcus sp. HG114]